MSRKLLLRVTCALLCLGSARVAAADPFSEHWHDGRAEIDGYRLSVDRYGETRHGVAVMIFVTEPMRLSTRVKADDTEQDPEDVVDVLKLNFVRDFQTGIYDYNTMTSVFSTTADFECLKVSFSSAEWCGHVYSETIPRTNSIEHTVHSYFEGESGSSRIERVADGLLEDELFLELRGLRAPFLSIGERLRLRVLPSSFVQRLLHRPPEWMDATFRRRENRTVQVPAGTFECEIYEITFSDGRHGEFAIESAGARRIVRWSLAPDRSGELTGTLRTAYWQQNAEGDEALLESLGLTTPPRTPR